MAQGIDYWGYDNAVLIFDTGANKWGTIEAGIAMGGHKSFSTHLHRHVLKDTCGRSCG